MSRTYETASLEMENRLTNTFPSYFYESSSRTLHTYSYVVSRLFGLRWASEYNESSLRDCDTPESGKEGNGSVTRALPAPLPGVIVRPESAR